MTGVDDRAASRRDMIAREAVLLLAILRYERLSPH
jgi:hypothetical protein